MHKQLYQGLLSGVMAGLFSLFAAAPASTNYTLQNYDVGNGGGSSSSTSYKLNGVSGTQDGSVQGSATYSGKTGVDAATDANVPTAATISNPSSYYDRLKIVISTANNPSDAKYLVAVSSDNFATAKYAQSDGSLGNSTAAVNYKTYAGWGGAGGGLLTGLDPSTSYKVKVKAMRGGYTDSGFGPASSAVSTSSTTLTVSLATSLTATPPFPVTFSSLTPGSVVSGNADALVGLTSNALNGGMVYVRDANNGLTSAASSSSIASATADLSVASSGYGARVTAASQVSGGPLTASSPYNGSGNNVGALSTALQPILSTSGPITTGSGTISLLAKSNSTTPSASDYADIVTFVVAMSY